MIDGTKLSQSNKVLTTKINNIPLTAFWEKIRSSKTYTRIVALVISLRRPYRATIAVFLCMARREVAKHTLCRAKMSSKWAMDSFLESLKHSTNKQRRIPTLL